MRTPFHASSALLLTMILFSRLCTSFLHVGSLIFLMDSILLGSTSMPASCTIKLDSRYPEGAFPRIHFQTVFSHFLEREP
jgi:hypothetical protein